MSFGQPEVRLSMPQENSVFVDYQRELISSISSAKTHIAKALSYSPEEGKTAAESLNKADQDVQEANDLLRSLELEARSGDANSRQSLQPQISLAREGVATISNELRAARIHVAQKRDDSNREELFGSASVGHEAISDITKTLEAGNEAITDSRRHIAQTEAIGASILEDLQTQRNTITRARHNLGQVDTGLDQSNNIISTMHRRAIVNKIVVYVVLAGIFIACLGVVYARLFHPKSTSL